MRVIYRFLWAINNHQYKTTVTIHRAGQCPACGDTTLSVHIDIKNISQCFQTFLSVLDCHHYCIVNVTVDPHVWMWLDSFYV